MAHDDENEKKRSWWQQRTLLERRGIVLIVIAILIIIGLIIAIALVSHKNKLDGNQSETVCLTPGCVQVAAQVLHNMDQSANPCDDFYQFACGGFIKETEIPADKSEVNVFNILDDALKKQLRVMFEEPPTSNEIKPFTLVKKLYNICMNTSAIDDDGLTTVKQFFKDAGGWPILEGRRWNEAGFDWKKVMQRFRLLGLNTDSFIALGVTYDPANSTRRMLILDQATSNVVHENLMRGFGDEVVNAYYKYLVDLAVFFGVDRNFAEYEVKNMVNFQIEIAKISLSDEQRRNILALYNPMTVTDLQGRYPSVDWLNFINSIIGREDKNINSNETVNVIVPSYISSLLNLVRRTSKREQANYAFFLAIFPLVEYLPDYVRNREQQFAAVTSGTSIRPPRWSECADVTSRVLNLAVGALYARNYFHEDARQNALEMVTDIRNAFVQIIKKLDWMDEETRKTAIDKAVSMTSHIGYPDEFLDDNKLEDYYAKLNITSGSYVKAMNEIDMFKMDKGLSQLKDPINKTDWTQRISAVTINARYYAQKNSIQFPAAILQGVFFNKDRPHYMNYGGIAYVIGHEVTHGFDDQGKHFDKEGNMVNWWANETDQAYMEKAQCIIDQYSEITVPELELNLNGANTQGENIADNGGIKEAYLAYEDWVGRNGAEPTLPGLNFTAKQMFWISAANCWCSKTRIESLRSDISTDTHSPTRYRVLVPFGNSDYFAKDFNCPVGSKMNPKKKCQVW